MEKIKLTRQELSFIIEMNLNPYALDEIITEGVFDKLATGYNNFKMKIQKCDLSKLDPRFTGLLISNDPRAPNIFGKIIDKIEQFVSANSLLGWRNILEVFYTIGKKLGIVVVGTGLVFFEIVKQVFNFLKIGLIPPLGPLCDYIVELSRLFGEVFESITKVLGEFIPSKPEFLTKLEEYLDSLPIFF